MILQKHSSFLLTMSKQGVNITEILTKIQLHTLQYTYDFFPHNIIYLTKIKQKSKLYIIINIFGYYVLWTLWITVIAPCHVELWSHLKKKAQLAENYSIINIY